MAHTAHHNIKTRADNPTPHDLLPTPAAIELDKLEKRKGIIIFHIKTLGSYSKCPECGTHSARAHSKYLRVLQDLPWQGTPVMFHLTLRRFFCDNTECPRRIFAENIPEIARRYQRKTARLESILLQLLWRLGAKAAAEIAKLLGLLISDDALLYQFKKAPRTEPKTSPEVLGIDDFAFRKGQNYGTILIDLQTRTPVDLLPDREKATVEKWLKEHPGAQIVSRDRSATYAEAIREGAPEAIHVADRFHILKNLMEVLEKQVGKESKAIRDILLPTGASLEDSGPAVLSKRQQKRKEETRQQRFEKWQKAHSLFKEGYAKKEIARQVGVNVRTIRDYLRSATYPERQRYSPKDGALTPYKEYILKRWEEGCHNALELLREVKQQGFMGGAPAVRDFVRPLRDPTITPTRMRTERAIPTPRALSWLLLLPDKRTKEQTEIVERLCASLPILTQSSDLVLSFQDMLRRRAPEELEDWLERAKASGLPGFESFVRGVRSDYAAVKAAFSLEWSNGPTEGHVNRLKFIKRQGYGRASFDLLKRRVLPLGI
jgi:transposase